MLTLQFVPYTEIEYLSSVGRIRKLLNITKENRIVLLQGRLRKEEETELIKATMEEIDKDFKGIELSVIYPDKKESDLFRKIKRNFVNMLLGDRQGLTIIGPASVVREIKKDPDKIQLLTEDDTKARKRRKS
ncbi:MAG: DUF2073 domain-containing protein [Nanoarchaeota archaeon]|nr:DUF2073 domain-containing protein [Nanoarchaeota archaeon]MBU4284351.1 DUF2073 domain-containing protein [Nanoarchaeota archaeon]